MNIRQIKAAIQAAVAFGDRKRWRSGSRTALNDLSIHAFEALCDVLPAHNNELSDVELTTIIGQVGYIFAKQYPVTTGSPADHTWDHFLKQLIKDRGGINGDEVSDSAILANNVNAIKNSQRNPSEAALKINTRSGQLIVKAEKPEKPDESIAIAQALSQHVGEALKSYYKRKNWSKINPAIVALEKLNLELMGQILSGAPIETTTYQARIVEIFTLTHPVKRGTLHNDTSYDVWLTLIPNVLPGQTAKPQEIHKTLSTSQSLRNASIQKKLTYASIQTTLKPPVSTKTIPPATSAPYGLSHWMSCLFGCWSSTQSKVSVADTDSIRSSHTTQNSEVTENTAQQTAAQRLGFTGDLVNIDIWQAGTTILDARKLLAHHEQWQDLAIAKTELWPQMIAGLKDDATAFRDQDDAFKATLIQQWPTDNRAQLLAHVDTWGNVSPAIYRGLGQKFADQPEAFSNRPEAFQVKLVNHWPLDHSAALFEHTAQWHTNFMRPVPVTQAIDQFIDHQLSIIQAASPEQHETLLTRVNTWYPDIRQAPDQIMPAIIDQCRINKEAFSHQSEAFKVALIEKWPADNDQDIRTLLAHVGRWTVDSVLPESIAVALSSKIKVLDSAKFQTCQLDWYQAHLRTPNDTVLAIVAKAIFDMADFINKLDYTSPAESHKIYKAEIVNLLKGKIQLLPLVQRGCALDHIQHVRQSGTESPYPILNDARRKRSKVTGSIGQQIKFNQGNSEKTLKAVLEFNYSVSHQNKLTV